MLHMSGPYTAISQPPILHQPPVPALPAVQVFELADDTVALRSLDHKRDRFDIEFALQASSTMQDKAGLAAGCLGCFCTPWCRQL